MDMTNETPPLDTPARARRLGPLLALLLVGAVAFGMRLAPGPEVLDDAYITYRIARNVATGQGFVYNPGERLQSSTTPAYALLLSTLARAGIDIPSASFVLNALAGALAAMLIFAACRRATGDAPAAFAGALLFAVLPGSVIYSIGGMETALFECLIAATCAAFLFRMDWLVAVLSGLLPLVRPEGLIISAIVGIGLLVTKRGRVWPYALVALLPLVLWLLWATRYFGTFIPHSVSEKQRFFADPRFAAGPLGFLRQWIYHYYSLFWANPVNFDGLRNTKYLAMLAGALPFAAGYAAQLWKSARACPRSLPLVLAPGLFAAVCIFGQAGLPFPWYFMPTNALFAAVSVCGLSGLARAAGSRRRPPAAQAALRWAVPVLAALLALHHLAAHYAFAPRFRPAALFSHIPPYREAVYVEAAKWMDSEPGDASEIVLCTEVGAIGYFCRFKVWDQHLTTPPWITERADALVDKYRPRFITFMGLYPPVPALASQPAEAVIGETRVAYRQIFVHNGSGDDGYPARRNVLIYERVDAPPAE